MPSVKVAVIGSGGVGKSSCTIRYLQNTFNTHYDPTIERSFRQRVTIDGKRVNLEVLDTAGQEELAPFRDASLSYCQGFLIVYAIDDEASFTEAKALVEKAKQHLEADSCENQAVVMVANKMDLESTRKVSKDDANAFAAGEKLTLIECSAKTGDNVSSAFETIVRRIGIPEGGDCCTLL